ncbi:hypothetical protein [Trujillonella humicola]|uniref:hypothetical protein n=1 Tax=Trujillonella humicola TaxID=3383699 RepID=UPI0039064423
MTSYADRLRILPQFRPDEYDDVRSTLFGRLENRLARWRPEEVQLELSMKDRDGKQQRTALECWITGLPKLVATSSEQDRNRALAEVRDDLWRQIDRQATKGSIRKG